MYVSQPAGDSPLDPQWMTTVPIVSRLGLLFKILIELQLTFKPLTNMHNILKLMLRCDMAHVPWKIQKRK